MQHGATDAELVDTLDEVRLDAGEVYQRDSREHAGHRISVRRPGDARCEAVSARKYVVRASRLSDLVELGSLSDQAARFLEAAVLAGLNIVVAGGTQAGAGRR